MKKSFRQKIGRYLFLREYRSDRHNRRLVSFEEAKSIGILYDSTNEKHFELVRKYVKMMREQDHKEVLALGYFDDKELPPMRFSKLGLDFFTRKDLNWYYKPIAPVVKNFVHREFDILIDLHTGNSIPFRYIVASSNAGFKIGKYDRLAVPFYDFMLSVSDTLTFSQFVEQVNHYLKSFNYESAH
ncbi:MAG: hypothetical protein IPJ86_13320 [Bacteroidetes bacterium]|nr:hypothetical protein [Bacteroidota bacterium]MBK9321167.1 hypothetical protein [Bacteroidota bacterium]